MSNSIEQIWSQGFISESALIAPKINELYNQKSKNIVDRYELFFKWNLIGLSVFACIVLVATSVFGIPYFGIFVASMLMVLVIKGREELAGLQQISKEVSSYQYLKSFDAWLKEMMSVYEKLYSFFYPALFLSIVLQFRFSELGQKVIAALKNKFPNMEMVLGTPVYALLAVVVLSGLLYYFSGALYRLDYKSVYGRMHAKLEELISDMEELRR